MKNIKTFESFFGLKRSSQVDFHEDVNLAIGLMDIMLNNPSGLSYRHLDVENPVIDYKSGDNSIRLHITTRADGVDHIGLLDKDIYTFDIYIDGKRVDYGYYFKSTKELSRKYSELLKLAKENESRVSPRTNTNDILRLFGGDVEIPDGLNSEETEIFKSLMNDMGMD